jgi:hypothetical protein
VPKVHSEGKERERAAPLPADPRRRVPVRRRNGRCSLSSSALRFRPAPRERNIPSPSKCRERASRSRLPPIGRTQGPDTGLVRLAIGDRDLPAPDAAGVIPMSIMTVTTPGRNAIGIAVQQGSRRVERQLDYEVTAQ